MNTNKRRRAAVPISPPLGTLPRVPRHPQWQLASGVSGGLFYVSGGPTEWVEFDQDEQTAFFEWLREAEWLDDLSENKLAQAYDAAAKALQRFGAITLVRRPSAPKFLVGPEGQLLAEDGRGVPPERVLESHSLPVARDPKNGGRPDLTYVGAPDLLAELVKLRTGLGVARSRFYGNDLWIKMVQDPQGTFSSQREFLQMEPLRTQARVDDPTLLAQMWFVTQLSEPGIQVFPIPSRGKLRLAFIPASAAQQLWLILAATAGVLDAPFPIDKVVNCSYQKCDRFFPLTRGSVRGKYRFCSPRCGRSFHAAAATRKRRKAEAERKREAQNEQAG